MTHRVRSLTLSSHMRQAKLSRREEHYIDVITSCSLHLCFLAIGWCFLALSFFLVLRARPFPNLLSFLKLVLSAGLFMSLVNSWASQYVLRVYLPWECLRWRPSSLRSAGGKSCTLVVPERQGSAKGFAPAHLNIPSVSHNRPSLYAALH